LRLIECLRICKNQEIFGITRSSLEYADHSNEQLMDQYVEITQSAAFSGENPQAPQDFIPINCWWAANCSNNHLCIEYSPHADPNALTHISLSDFRCFRPKKSAFQRSAVVDNHSARSTPGELTGTKKRRPPGQRERPIYLHCCWCHSERHDLDFYES
jgi:hypothetical protein